MKTIRPAGACRKRPSIIRDWVKISVGTLLSIGSLRAAPIGTEVSIQRHLNDGQEYELSTKALLSYGEKLFSANWTRQEGGGRPLTKGNGKPLTDTNAPLVFPRAFNRLSGPDANSCAGCHNFPVAGGYGDIVANAFVSGQRFDFLTFAESDGVPMSGAVDERNQRVTLQGVADPRATVGLFGAGFVEMLARQITTDLQRIRDSLQPGDSKPLISKGVHFGKLTRRDDGSWDTTEVTGLPPNSLTASDTNGPNLFIRPFSHSAIAASIRQFSNNAFNQHLGIQSAEKFGKDTDPDGDGYSNELTRADVTAVSLFQAAMAVPGRVIPNDAEIERAVLVGEERFSSVGCVRCHIPTLPLDNGGWIFSEPGPFNSSGTLRSGDVPSINLDLTSETLPAPRLQPIEGIVHVPAFTDFKLHNISSGLDDPNREPLDSGQSSNLERFFGGNSFFLTRRLWGGASKPNYFHHGQFTTMREAILAHAGEALEERMAFQALSEFEQSCIIEFLKTLQILPAATKSLVVDELGAPKEWPPNRFISIARAGDEMTLRWQGSAGIYQVQRQYQIQKRSLSGSENWENIEEPTTNTILRVKPAGEAVIYRVKLLAK